MRSIDFVNQSTVVGADELAAVVAALQIQVTRDFAPVWQIQAQLQVATTQTPGRETILILDDSDQADALGYHELSKSDIPTGFVFAKTCRDNGTTWSSCASHELLEQLVDPDADGARITTWNHHPAAVMAEVADPVESDSYTINGVEVSNFILPLWWEANSPGPWDYLRKLKGPLTMTSGGYVAYSTNLRNWNQSVQNELRPVRRAINRYTRRARKRHLVV